MVACIRSKIDEIADKVRRIYHISAPIRDMSKIVEKMGGIVKYDDINLSELSDAYVKKVSSDCFEIYVSSKSSPERRNFAIACAIGHLFLHMGYKTDRKLWNSIKEETICDRFGQSDAEYQANEFAAAFLMPEKLFADVLRQNLNDDTVNMESVAKYFCASVGEAVARGRDLGYLSR